MSKSAYEYQMPEEIKSLVSKDLLDYFREELNKVFKNINITLKSEADFSMMESTGGWGKAFNTACMRSGQAGLAAYYKALNWSDSDLFDAEITDLAVQFGVIEKDGWYS